MTDATEVKPWGGSASLTDRVPKGWYTIQQAADEVGRDRSTLKRWHNNATAGKGIGYEPSGYMKAGRLRVWLYSDKDIQAMRRLASTSKPGRPKKAVAAA